MAVENNALKTLGKTQKIDKVEQSSDTVNQANQGHTQLAAAGPAPSEELGA